MSLPPLASLDDLEARLPTRIDADDMARAEAALADASALVRTEARKTWADDDGDELVDVPDIIVTVTVAIARRGFLNPDGYRQETLGDHSVTYNAEPYLTDDEKALIAASNSTGPTGLWTLTTTRCTNDLPDIYLDVVASEQIPHVPTGEINW